MMRTEKKIQMIVILLIAITLLAATISLSLGSFQIPLSKIPSILLGNGSKFENNAIFHLRLPRIAIAIVVGIALSIAGSLLQTITGNELADSGMIGINAGASLAAVLFITSQSSNYYDELGHGAIMVLPALAMAGAFLVALLLYLLSVRQGLAPRRLILVGIGINIAINAFITFYSLGISQGQYNRVLVWTSGSLWGSNWTYFTVVAPAIIIFAILSLMKHKTLDVLNLGDELATGLGVNSNRQRKLLLLLAVVLAGLATSVAGNISFLGLLSPHIARKLVGPTHKKFMITGALISAITILLADSISRNLFSPIEIPVGITISLLGVPYFLSLVMRK